MRLGLGGRPMAALRAAALRELRAVSISTAERFTFGPSPLSSSITEGPAGVLQTASGPISWDDTFDGDKRYESGPSDDPRHRARLASQEALREKIWEFKQGGSSGELVMQLNSWERKQCHAICDDLGGLAHESQGGEGEGRRLHIWATGAGRE